MELNIKNNIFKMIACLIAVSVCICGCSKNDLQNMIINSNESSSSTVPTIVVENEEDISDKGAEDIEDKQIEDESVTEDGEQLPISDDSIVDNQTNDNHENDNQTNDNQTNDNYFQGYELSETDKSSDRVKCIESASDNQVVLAFAGDINFDDGYSNMNNYRSMGQGIRGVLSGDLMKEMNAADIFMINNEFPYSDRGTPTPNKTFTFRVKPEHVEDLKEMGADIVSLANNHAYDYGPEALMDTFDVLKEAGIPYVGAGENIDEAAAPFYFISGGMKLAYVSATQIERNDPPDTKEATKEAPGVLRTQDPTRFLKTIEEAEDNADFTVVYVHWGSENTYEVDYSQKDLARAFADAGADLIIGDHSHCLQGFEFVGDVPVIYSMGNFWFSSKNIDTGLVEVTVNKEGVDKVKFVPCVQHDCRTDMYKPGDGEYERILGVMAGLSMDVSIDTEGYVHKGAGNGVAPRDPKPLKKASYQLTEEEKAQLALQEALESGEQ